MRKIWLSVFLITLLCANSFGHITLLKNYNQQQATFKTEKVAGNIYVLYGEGGNIGVSYGEDGMMIIDTQYARVADKVKTELAKSARINRALFLTRTGTAITRGRQ